MLHTVYLQVPPIGEYFQLANSEGFPGGSVVKILASNSGVTGDVSPIPGPGTSVEWEMATHFSILAWKIRWTEELGKLQSLGSQRVGHD